MHRHSFTFSSRPNVMRLLRKCIWLGLLGLVGVIAAEVMARVDDAVRSGTEMLASPAYTDLTMQDSLGTRGRPFAQFEKWKLNGEGFRSQEVAINPRPECVRVAVMGASETFGYAESPGKEYPAQLADSLRHTGCYEVINTGITGLPTTGQIQLWENWVSRFEPSVVVIYVSPAFYLSNEPPEFHSPNRGGPGVISNSFAPRLVGRLKNRIDYPDFIQRRRVMRQIANELRGRPATWLFQDIPDDRLALFRLHLDSLVTSVRARGAVPVLVTHAMRFGGPMNEEEQDLLRSWRRFSPRATEAVLMEFERRAAGTVREEARDRDVPLVDVANVMTGHTGWFADFSHFNDTGAGVIAGTIARTLEQVRVPSGFVASEAQHGAAESRASLATNKTVRRSIARASSIKLANRSGPR
jgi:hypothetical protein